jgi:hypothetical protein
VLLKSVARAHEEIMADPNRASWAAFLLHHAEGGSGNCCNQPFHSLRIADEMDILDSNPLVRCEGESAPVLHFVRLLAATRHTPSKMALSTL